MKTLPFVLVGLLVCGSVGSVACGAAPGTHSGRIATTNEGKGAASQTRVVVVPWAPVSVGSGRRSLAIRYADAPCSAGPGQVQLQESANAITIHVWQPTTTSRKVSCSALARFPIVRVRLRQQIHGRALNGGARTLGPVPAFRTMTMKDPPKPPIRLPLVPNVVGLRTRDAVSVLAGDGLHAHVMGGNGEVISQKPTIGRVAPGTTQSAPFGGRVTLIARR